MYFRLEVYRRHAGLSQHDVAKLVGVSQAHICDMEHQKTVPTLFLAKRIANVFAVSLDEMIDDSEGN